MGSRANGLVSAERLAFGLGELGQSLLARGAADGGNAGILPLELPPGSGLRGDALHRGAEDAGDCLRAPTMNAQLGDWLSDTTAQPSS